MPLTIEDLREHVAYSAWASEKLVHAVLDLPETELLHDFQTSDHTILGTLVHTFAADRLWLSRLRKSPIQQFISPADHQLSVLRDDWPEVYRQWDGWLATLGGDEVSQALTYQDLRGTTWTHPIWKLILHVVNHGTHHRGQVSGFLRALGRVPPAIDLVAYYRK